MLAMFQQLAKGSGEAASEDQADLYNCFCSLSNNSNSN